VIGDATFFVAGELVALVLPNQLLHVERRPRLDQRPATAPAQHERRSLDHIEPGAFLGQRQSEEPLVFFRFEQGVGLTVQLALERGQAIRAFRHIASPSTPVAPEFIFRAGSFMDVIPVRPVHGITQPRLSLLGWANKERLISG
jgi:hypothetical protein